MLPSLTIIIRTCKTRLDRSRKLADVLRAILTDDVRVVDCVMDVYYSEDFLFKLSQEAKFIREYVLVLEDDMIFSTQTADFLMYLISKQFQFVWCTLEKPSVLNHSMGQDLFGLHLIRCKKLSYSGAVFYNRSTLRLICEQALLSFLDDTFWKYDLAFSSLACRIFSEQVWVSGACFATDPQLESAVETTSWIKVGRTKNLDLDSAFDFKHAIYI